MNSESAILLGFSVAEFDAPRNATPKEFTNEAQGREQSERTLGMRRLAGANPNGVLQAASKRPTRDEPKDVEAPGLKLGTLRAAWRTSTRFNTSIFATQGALPLVATLGSVGELLRSSNAVAAADSILYVPSRVDTLTEEACLQRRGVYHVPIR